MERNLLKEFIEEFRNISYYKDHSYSEKLRKEESGEKIYRNLPIMDKERQHNLFWKPSSNSCRKSLSGFVILIIHLVALWADLRADSY